MAMRLSNIPLLVALAFVLLGLALPPVFVGKTDVSPPEEFCAWRGALAFVYTLPGEDLLIRAYEVHQVEPGETDYMVFPRSFFGLPWRMATVHCEIQPDGRMVATNGWPESPVPD